MQRRLAGKRASPLWLEVCGRRFMAFWCMEVHGGGFMMVSLGRCGSV